MRIFISYRRQDSASDARLVRDHIERAFGPGSAYLDVAEKRPGDFRDPIDENLARCNAMVVLIGAVTEWLGESDGSLPRINRENDIVRYEVAAALDRDDTVVLPILLDGTRMPVDDELPESLKLLQWQQGFEVRRASFEHDIQIVLDRLEAIDPDAAPMANQSAAIAVGGEIRWLRPVPGAPTLTAGLDRGGAALAGSSIALSSDGAVAAQVIKNFLTVYALGDAKACSYERWQSVPLDRSWEQPRVVAIRRRGSQAVQLAICYHRTGRYCASKVARTDVRRHDGIVALEEIDGDPVIASYIGSTLLYLDKGAHHVWEWSKEGVIQPWQTNPEVDARWLDTALDNGDVLLAVLGDCESAGARPERRVVLFASHFHLPQRSYVVSPGSQQVTIPRKLDHGDYPSFVVQPSDDDQTHPMRIRRDLRGGRE
jgi:hypothetical protein